MTDRYDTITVALDEPIREDDIEGLLNAIRLLDRVAGVEPGRVDNVARISERHRIRMDLHDAIDEVLDGG